MAKTTYHVIESDTPNGLQDIVNERLARPDAKWELVGGITFSMVALGDRKLSLSGNVDGCSATLSGTSTMDGDPGYSRIFAQAMTMTTLD